MQHKTLSSALTRSAGPLPEWPDMATLSVSAAVDDRPDLSFRTTVPIPEIWGSYLQAIRGIASVERMLDDEIEIVIEAKDEYELAGYVHELEQELRSISGDTVDIPRPTPVEKP